MTTSLTKSDLTEIIHYGTNQIWGVPRSASRQAAKGLLAAMRAILIDGGEIRLDGIGVLSLKDVPQRPGRNPRTGEPLTIEPYRKGQFRLTKSLKRP